MNWQKFVKEVKRVVRESRYKNQALIEKFKRRMNKHIWRKLLEVDQPPRSINQWYEQEMNLDKHWRKSKREKTKLSGRNNVQGWKPAIITIEEVRQRLLLP